MTKIKVNVFNLTPLNKVFACFKVGVYHTSIVIGEEYEYYYGFCQRGITGIDGPEVINQLPSVMQGSFNSSHEIGETSLSVEECREICHQLKASDKWLSDYYHVLYHNCNSFTLEFCKILVGENNVQNYPYWVTRSESIGRFVFNISLSHFLGFVRYVPGFSFPKEVCNFNKYQGDSDPYDIDEVGSEGSDAVVTEPSHGKNQ
ncbi:hypothetical protein TVAG_074890 [Trichomonas vaginalis G3]|uniref:PPPDE domain-containing protein n=1 Tax=Trichomonas vaginalis (strain ATCC PRA-98 / G3) TaxID=412133 RepID=A2E406_TRIV3|nr:hypothetical protein TVAG_074890 [Trichomonas vaginalis G3]|eukprot:XP_001324884.1 hypothetical protein [Trichomonas vaginalis G3]